MSARNTIAATPRANRRFINADGYASTGQGFIGTNMFAYCNNNPTAFMDNGGKAAEEVAGWWSSVMWWLCAIDGALPIGDIIYWVGCGVCFLIIIDEVNDAATTPNFSKSEKKGEGSKVEPKAPDVTYPGDDPEEAPEGYEWRGPDKQGGARGGYVNPNGKDSWHPDLDHDDPPGCTGIIMMALATSGRFF